jgi:hypothetical protein
MRKVALAALVVVCSVLVTAPAGVAGGDKLPKTPKSSDACKKGGYT